MGLAWRYIECINSVLDDVNLWNGLGFSLYTVLSVCYVITTSDDVKKSKMGVSADWCVTVEHWGSSSIRVIFINYQTSKLQCNY